MHTSRLVVLLATAAVLVNAPLARAQNPAGGSSTSGASSPASPDSDEDAPKGPSRPKWEIELHGGVGVGLGTPQGSGSLPLTGAVSGGVLSASTFYFGSGTSLMNANLAAANAGSASLTPLDSVLLGTPVTRRPQAIIGLRLQRELTSRFAVAGTVDVSVGALAFEPSALTTIEAARSSYAVGLQRALASPTLASAVSSVSTISDQQRSTQAKVTGALIVNLTDDRRLMPFVTIGGGYMTASETMPSAKLVGSSQLGNDTQIFWTDTVALNYTQDTHAVIVLGGGGVKYRVSPHLGIRADATLQVMRNTWTSLVDVTAGRSLETTGAPFPSLTFGTAQFNVNGPLNGTSYTGGITRSGSGLEQRVVLTTGFYVRF